MNKTDKIVISLILVLAVIMGLVMPIKTFATYGDENNPVIQAENYNADLEVNSNLKSKIKFGKILQSNGDLWEMANDIKLNKIDTNVSDCYFYEGQVKYILLGNCILYKDNKLKIEGKWIDKNTREIVKTNNVNLDNVKKILYKNRGYFNYLDSKNNIYQIDCFGEKKEPILLASNVKNAWDYYYTKDGVTYKFDYEGTEVEKTINEEIKDEYNYSWVVNLDNCLCRFYNNMETFKKIDPDFKEVIFKNTVSDPIYYNNSNEIKQPKYNSVYNEQSQQWVSDYTISEPKYVKMSYDIGFRYVLYPNKDLKCLTETTTYLQLTNVIDMVKLNGTYVAIRSDGTVWASKGGENEKFTKIIGKNNINEHTHTWNAGSITKKATCKEEGIKTYTCTGCSEKKTEKIEKLAHNYKTITKPATQLANGKVTVECAVGGETKSTKTIPKIQIISLSKTAFTYNEKVQKPTVTVKDSKGNILKNGIDYTLSYSNKNSKKVREYSVTVTFKGNYEGKKRLTYRINPKGTSLKKLLAGKKQFKATWNKQVTETTGYEIQYSTNKNFKSGNKISKINKNKTNSSEIKGLIAKKKYYVRIRTYKIVNGKIYYSSWSKAKNITIKK